MYIYIYIYICDYVRDSGRPSGTFCTSQGDESPRGSYPYGLAGCLSKHATATDVYL